MSDDSFHGGWVREWPPAVCARIQPSYLLRIPQASRVSPYRNKQDFVNPHSFC